jgi:hypothetical protein
MRLSRCIWILAGSLWIVSLAVGWGALLRHQLTPGVDLGVPDHWPKDSALPLDSERETLVLFAHRHCPCTRTTLQELEQILADAPRSARVFIVLLAPAEAAEDRVGNAIEQQARSLPGVEVRIDPEGTEARRFDVRTSGQLVLYANDGRLLFSGGITGSRAHSGDNEGRRSVLAWLRKEQTGRRSAPVYGCPLFGDEDEREAEVH